MDGDFKHFASTLLKGSDSSAPCLGEPYTGMVGLRRWHRRDNVCNQTRGPEYRFLGLVCKKPGRDTHVYTLGTGGTEAGGDKQIPGAHWLS